MSSWGAVDERQVHGYKMGPEWVAEWQSSKWMDVQGGELVLAPELGIVILSPLPHRGDPTVTLRRFEVRHGGRAEQLGPETSEPFLIFQRGGGVERLQLQLALTADGRFWVWDPDLGNCIERPRLLAATTTSLGHEAARLFDLADQAEIASRQEVDWACETLDGSAHSILYFDGHSLGRVHLVTNRYPPGKVTELMDRLVKVYEQVRPEIQPTVVDQALVLPDSKPSRKMGEPSPMGGASLDQ